MKIQMSTNENSNQNIPNNCQIGYKKMRPVNRSIFHAIYNFFYSLIHTDTTDLPVPPRNPPESLFLQNNDIIHENNDDANDNNNNANRKR